MKHCTMARHAGGRAAAISCCVCCCILMAACSHLQEPTEQPVDSSQAVPQGSPNPAFELEQRERARDLTRQAAYGEAVVAWEVLALLRPDVDEYTENLQRIRSRIEARVTRRIQAADQARRRGENEQAAQLYLQVLADDPLNSQAADGLRATERERNKRNYLGQLSRLTLMRSASAEVGQSRPAAPAADRNDLEHASLLMHQSEYAEAIRILERYLRAFPQDEAARKALAEACFQLAERRLTSDPKSARSLLQRAVKVDPAHDQATRRLKQLDGGSARPAPAVPAARR